MSEFEEEFDIKKKKKKSKKVDFDAFDTEDAKDDVAADAVAEKVEDLDRTSSFSLCFIYLFS
jgi:hypothetical protein